MGDITELLGRARDGDSRALDAVFDALYEGLRQIARLRLRTHPRDVLLDTSGVDNDDDDDDAAGAVTEAQ